MPTALTLTIFELVAGLTAGGAVAPPGMPLGDVLVPSGVTVAGGLLTEVFDTVLFLV